MPEIPKIPRVTAPPGTSRVVDRRLTRKQVLWIVGALVPVAALVAVVFLGYVYDWEWVGVAESYRPKPSDQDIRRQKTLWDWMQLLIVPVVLAAGTFLLTQRAKRGEEARANQQARDSALQSYLDQVSDILADDTRARSLRDADIPAGRELRVLARARTLTALGQLDGERKRSVLQFLHEAKLIEKRSPVISLDGADLKDAELADLNLSSADLKRADLRGANLRGASLIRSDLEAADLRRADLTEANLASTNLKKADLSDANLRWTHANLCQHQLDETEGNSDTIIPEGPEVPEGLRLRRPDRWLSPWRANRYRD
jgi:hypothetical protein